MISVCVCVCVTYLQVERVRQFITQFGGVEFLQQTSGFAQFQEILGIADRWLDVCQWWEFCLHVMLGNVVDEVGDCLTGPLWIEKGVFRDALRLQETVDHHLRRSNISAIDIENIENLLFLSIAVNGRNKIVIFFVQRRRSKNIRHTWFRGHRHNH